MLKNIFLPCLILLLWPHFALADIVYTEEIKKVSTTSSLGSFKQQESSKKKVSIKAARKKIDDLEAKKSLLIMYDKNKVVEIDHRARTFSVKSLNQQLAEMKEKCNSSKLFHNLANNYDESKKSSLSAVIEIKKETSLSKMPPLADSYYIKATKIIDNNTDKIIKSIKEEIWTGNIAQEEFKCALNNAFNDCTDYLIDETVGDFRHKGLKSIDGFIIKKHVEVEELPDKIENKSDSLNNSFNGFNSTQIGENISITVERKNIQDLTLPHHFFEIPQGYTYIKSFFYHGF